MKSTLNKSQQRSEIRAQILKSLIASFKIEDIHIPVSVADAKLKKVEINLEK